MASYDDIPPATHSGQLPASPAKVDSPKGKAAGIVCASQDRLAYDLDERCSNSCLIERLIPITRMEVLR